MVANAVASFTLAVMFAGAIILLVAVLASRK